VQVKSSKCNITGRLLLIVAVAVHKNVKIQSIKAAAVIGVTEEIVFVVEDDSVLGGSAV
jgi:hypothetical protein